MNKIYILGSGSFVAKAFYRRLKAEKTPCFLLSKEELNFLRPETFLSFDFNNSVIVDFINVNNGNEKEITNCNYNGFMSFCSFLLKNSNSFKYVYISTISVISEQIVTINAYVKSKKLAEDFLKNSGIDYQIIRLSYPIGLGENKDRLITRLITNLKTGKEIKANRTLVNLNDVNDVAREIALNLLNKQELFISNNEYIDLSEIVLFLKKNLNSESKIEIAEAGFQFTPLSEEPYAASRNIKETLLQML